MKQNRTLLMSIIIILALVIIVVQLPNKTIVETPMNLEALAQGEAVITCDSGDYGLCHTMAYDVQLGGLIIYYYCQWTGRQEDNCPFSVYLLNGSM